MGRLHPDLKPLYFDIQRERALLNALKRHANRMIGKEVSYRYKTPDAETDTERILHEWGTLPETSADAQHMIKLQQEHLNGLQAELAQKKHEIESRLPLTPAAWSSP
ncbi:MAG: hypothetical protein OXI52_09050 [Caldilineaceae bacterium]|nr:hypothetical protein [Caldilineaceae bacterium]